MKLKSCFTNVAQRGQLIYLILTVILLFTNSCASNKPLQIEMMPAPEVYANSTVDPFLDLEKIGGERMPYRGILYATDRKPAGKKESLYENQRGFLLRLGLAKVTVGKKDLDWEEARRVSLLKNRPENIR